MMTKKRFCQNFLKQHVVFSTLIPCISIHMLRGQKFLEEQYKWMAQTQFTKVCGLQFAANCAGEKAIAVAVTSATDSAHWFGKGGEKLCCQNILSSGCGCCTGALWFL